MLKNYLKIIFRNLNRHKFYAFINITGLAIGMACAMLIGLYVLQELSYDRFHQNEQRIYRVVSQIKIGETEFEGPFVSSAAAESILRQIPEVEKITRMIKPFSRVVRQQDIVFTENGIMAADVDFFEIFSFEMITGNPATALLEPNSVVLTEEKAGLYFPHEMAIGKMITIGGDPYKVTGVMASVPVNSHFHFDMLLSYASFPGSGDTEWTNLNVYTYMLLKEGSTASGLNEKLTSLLARYGEDYKEIYDLGGSWKMYAQPMGDIHLYSHLDEEFQPNGSIRDMYVFSAIGLFVLVIACINFMNLATARSGERAKEVGIRKVLGSVNKQLSAQFMAESLLMSSMAFIVALGLVEAVIIPFNQLSGKDLTFNLLEDTLFVVSFFVMAIFVGAASGSYPALYIARFRPAEALAGRVQGVKNSVFRNFLVVFQFVVSIALVICTILVYQQLEYMQNIDLGLNKDHVLIISNSHVLEHNQETFYHALNNHSRIGSVSFSDGIPFGGKGYNGTTFLEKGKEDNQSQIIHYLRVSHDFTGTLGIKISEGRNFSYKFGRDTAAVILNQAAADRLGLHNPVGKKLEWDGKESTIIGITENYNFQSLHGNILPLALILDKEQDFVEVKLNQEDISSSLAFIKDQWDVHTGGAPFDYSFLDENFDALFRSEQRLGKVFAIFTGLAIFIACMGLLGLTAFSLQKRTKEIGIRKILGASAFSIVIMLCKNYTKLILLAILFAAPASWTLMNQWLEGFAYRIDIEWWVFAGAGIGAILTGLLTIGFQSIKAALASPVNSLRSE